MKELYKTIIMSIIYYIKLDETCTKTTMESNNNS